MNQQIIKAVSQSKRQWVRQPVSPLLRQSLVRLLANQSFNQSVTQPVIHSFVRSFVLSFLPSFIHLFIRSGYVHTTPEVFENGGFTPKTQQVFSFQTTQEKFENATITSHFGFVLDDWLGQRNHVIIMTPSCFQNVICPQENGKLLFKNSLQFEETLWSSFFRDGFVWTVGLTVEIKLRSRDG